jgi:hypothetical protein
VADRRIHLKDYSEAELREIPAGALCEWLVEQIAPHELLGVLAGDWTLICESGATLVWDTTEDDEPREHWQAYNRPSSHWSAAGPLLERLMREHGAWMRQPRPGTFHLVYAFDAECATQTIVAPTPQLAICRAALVIARRKLEA